MADLFPVAAVDEPKSLRLRGRDIPYVLRRSQKRRSIVMTIDQRGLVVAVPWRTRERRVLEFLEGSADWILRKLEVWSRHPSRNPTWTHGDRIRFLGRELHLDLASASITSATLEDNDRLRVGTAGPASPEAVHVAVVRWYRRHAHAHFPQRIAQLAPRLGVAAPRFFLSSARTRWGSCNSRGDIRLNWRLMQATPATIDYVVVHELAHLIELNHSRRFWALVATACPDYRNACDELDRMGPYYMET